LRDEGAGRRRRLHSSLSSAPPTPSPWTGNNTCFCGSVLTVARLWYSLHTGVVGRCVIRRPCDPPRIALRRRKRSGGRGAAESGGGVGECFTFASQYSFCSDPLRRIIPSRLARPGRTGGRRIAARYGGDLWIRIQGSSQEERRPRRRSSEPLVTRELSQAGRWTAAGTGGGLTFGGCRKRGRSRRDRRADALVSAMGTERRWRIDTESADNL